MDLGRFSGPAGAALISSGLHAVRRRPITGAALFVAGLAGVAVADSRIRRQLTASPEPVVYQPADTPKMLAEDVWVVDSGPLHGVLPLRMTVVRLPDGGLLLHSPTPSTAAVRSAIDRLGPVRALVAPSPAHWMYVVEWQRTYPAAKTWAAPGLGRRKQVRDAGMRIDGELGSAAPAEWGGVLEPIPVPGGMGFVEFALYHQPSRTLVLTDLVLNLELRREPLAMRGLIRLLGAAAPAGRAPAHVRALFRAGGPEARRAAARLVALQPARVVMAHGSIFEGDAPDALRRSLSWLLPKEEEHR
jgi:hypothetical protein